MKKTLALIFALILCVSFSFTAFAADYTVGADGNAVYESAVGYVFDIEDVNGTINGEDATILTSADGLANCGSWAIWLVAEKVEGSSAYKAVTNGAAMGGTSPSVTLEEGQIIIVVHSSSSNPNDAATYPNWEDKVACMAIKVGDYLKFDGINLAAGTCENGTMTVITEDELADLPAEEESSEAPVESSEAPAESSEEAPAESSEAANEAVSDATPNEASTEDSDVKSSEMEIDSDGGLGVWLWVIIGVAVVAVVAVIAVLAKKKQ